MADTTINVPPSLSGRLGDCALRLKTSKRNVTDFLCKLAVGSLKAIVPAEQVGLAASMAPVIRGVRPETGFETIGIDGAVVEELAKYARTLGLNRSRLFELMADEMMLRMARVEVPNRHTLPAEVMNCVGRLESRPFVAEDREAAPGAAWPPKEVKP